MINFVYITTDLTNGKQYIGSHKGYENDSYLGSGVLISKAIKKRGKHNFNRKIIKKCETILEARILEEKYIKKYNTLIPEGYNISPDGGIMLWENHSKESKEKISESLKGKSYEDIYGDNADMMREKRSKERSGLKFSKEWKNNLSKSLKGKKLSDSQKNQIGNFHRGKIVSKKTANKISESKRGKKLIHNEKLGINKFVSANEIDIYLNDGWSVGGLKKLNK